MNTLLVSYDLRAPQKDYEKLWDHLKSYPNWARPLESVWLIKTVSSAQAVRDAIRDNYIDSNDKLFVVDVTRQAAAWRNLGAELDQWIKNNV